MVPEIGLLLDPRVLQLDHEERLRVAADERRAGEAIRPRRLRRDSDALGALIVTIIAALQFR
jgi:hypothetical protein